MGNVCSGEGVKASELATEIDPERDDSAEESADDDDDYVDELPPPASYLKKGPRSSVSAEAYGAWNQKATNFTAPVYPKGPAVEQRLRNSLQRSFMFNSLDEKDLAQVIGAFKQMDVKPGGMVIQQGDEDAKELFMLESGYLEVYKKISKDEAGDGKCVFQYNSPGDVFGELALLYNCPRAATVKARDQCILWTIDRETFNHLVKDAASRKRNMYEQFLKSVEILSNLDTYEISQVADALQAKIMKKGEKIITQGDVGNEFYILEEGEASAVKDGKSVKSYKTRDYFGELALMRGTPRQADVVVDSPSAKVLSIDRQSFKRLLGPLDKLMERKAQEYTKAK
mmetsp:Transcript_122479/g.280720  ORF Transcript_122479/g.280720 Transcript_122479/m.280720 type:complete len:341 (+) Transcript_122479:94-1116(+)